MGELLYNEDSHSSRVGVLSLVLFESILLHQLPQFAVRDACLVRLVVDGDERDVETVSLDEHGMGDDSCTSTLALGF